MIDGKKEYDFKFTDNYGKDVFKILDILRKEYPMSVKRIENADLGFEVTGLIIHSINLSRQIKK